MRGYTRADGMAEARTDNSASRHSFVGNWKSGVEAWVTAEQAKMRIACVRSLEVC